MCEADNRPQTGPAAAMGLSGDGQEAPAASAMTAVARTGTQSGSTGSAGKPSGVKRAKGRRAKLWELNGNMFCSIVGTSLTLDDLHAISKKLGLRFPPDMQAYELHGYFVREAGHRDAAGRMMQKRLDRRHQQAIGRFSRLSGEAALAAAWDECREAGNIPGPYWALMTHPETSDALITRAFGEVHMLSHMVGASNRGDLNRKSRLQTDNERLSTELHAMRKRLNEADAQIQDLQRRLVDEETRAREQQHRADAIAGVLRETEQTLEAVRRGDEQARADQEIASLRRTVSDLEHRLRLSETLADERKQALGRLNAERTEPDASDAAMDDDDPDIDLDGRRIVYVGGRSGAMGHFRSVVEQANGVFIHHDGGMEDKIARLPRTLEQGDTVVCPVDCVSHSACQLAKKFCKRNDCPFVLLRSSGLSSFVNALNEIAVQQDGARA